MHLVVRRNKTVFLERERRGVYRTMKVGFFHAGGRAARGCEQLIVRRRFGDQGLRVRVEGRG